MTENNYDTTRLMSTLGVRSMKDEKNTTDMSSLLHTVRSMQGMVRYPNKYRHKKTTVASHSWFVGIVAVVLAKKEMEYNTEGVDIGKVGIMSLIHDISESLIGDVLTTTKRYTPEIQRAFDGLEHRVFVEHIVPQLPEGWREETEELYKEISERKTINAKIVKAADLIDRLYECRDEILLGNKEQFEDIIREDIQTLYSYNIKSVTDFLDTELDELGLQKYN